MFTIVRCPFRTEGTEQHCAETGQNDTIRQGQNQTESNSIQTSRTVPSE